VLYNFAFGSEMNGRSVGPQIRENDGGRGRLGSVPRVVGAVSGRTLHPIELHSKDV
jgi:hypothetical protein